MELHAKKEKNAMVISVRGRLDTLTSPDFENQLSGMISEGESLFLLNLSEVEYISSAGLRSILSIAKKLKNHDGKICLAGLKGPAEEVFKISGFLSLFKSYASEEAALKEV
jgi:anti-sigma B factor antagonist/stage II sporulation protein AA (anti-sigma F factor antagonist)